MSRLGEHHPLRTRASSRDLSQRPLIAPRTQSSISTSSTSSTSTPALRPISGSRQNMQFEQMSTPPRPGHGSPGQMRGVARGMNGADRKDVNSEFEKLLDHLQISETVRAKLTPLDTPIKESMLRSSQQPRLQGLRTQSFYPVGGSPSRNGPPSTPMLRKTRSGSSLGSPGTPIRGNDAIPESPSWRSTMTVDDDKFVMIRSNAQTPVGHKRLTTDGLPMPPPLPGDSLPEELASTAGRRDKRASFDLASMRERAGSLAGGSFSSKGSIFSKNKSSKAPGAGTGPGSVFLARGTQPEERKRTKSKPDVKSAEGATSKEVPENWAKWLSQEDTFKMDLGKVKRLRMLLRHETTEWVQAFLYHKGYDYILARLKDLLDVEWREEQHDDQLLTELLRCIKAVETAEVGRETMRAFGTSPFRELTELLYSDKKPGEVVTRRFIIEIIQSLLQIYPESAAPSGLPASTSRPGSRPTTISFSEQSVPMMARTGSRPNMRAAAASSLPIPENHPHISLYIASLLKHQPAVKALTDIFQQPAYDRSGSRILCPASELPAPKPDVHDFLKQAHKDRVYKQYLGEINDVCRDFFWVMCHSENGLWELAKVDLNTIKPQAPSGASGGVEYEAMDYLTAHFQMLNALGRSLYEHDMEDRAVREGGKKGEAWRFFQDMVASGLDPTLVTVRKASVDFYPHFHLEVAKFIRLAIDVGADLSYPVKRLLCEPPAQYAKREEQVPTRSPYTSYQLAAGVGRGGGGFLDTANEQFANSREWERPTAEGNYDFQM